MLEITEENIDSILTVAVNTGYMKQDLLDEFIKFVYITSYIRPKSPHALALLIKKANNDVINRMLHFHFKKYLIEDPMIRVKTVKNIQLYRSLYDVGLIEKKFINEQIIFIRLTLEMIPQLIGQILPFACYFNDLFPKDILDRYLKFNCCYLDLFKFNEKYHDDYHYVFNFAIDNSKYKPELSRMIQSIIADDVGSVQEIVSQPLFDINQDIEIWEHHQFFIHGTKLIDAAAFYGSINTFKYLMMNGAKFHDNNSKMIIHSTGEYAVAGGNLEIVRILDQSHFEFGKEELLTSLLFHHNEIASWINDRLILSYDFYRETKMFVASLTNNLEFFASNQISFSGRYMWPIAKYGFIELVNFFNLSSDQVIDKEKTLLDYVCKYQHKSTIHSFISKNDPRKDVLAGYLSRKNSYLDYKDGFILVYDLRCECLFKVKLEQNEFDYYQWRVSYLFGLRDMDLYPKNGYFFYGNMHDNIPMGFSIPLPLPSLNFLKIQFTKIPYQNKKELDFDLINRLQEHWGDFYLTFEVKK